MKTKATLSIWWGSFRPLCPSGIQCHTPQHWGASVGETGITVDGTNSLARLSNFRDGFLSYTSQG